MRVSPSDLKAVRAQGIVARYAVLGDVAFVLAELPDGGTAGTAMEEPCRLEHWGLVLRGELQLEGRRTRTLRASSAFYVAPGPVHRFRAMGTATVAGFAPVVGEIDESPETLRGRGIEVLRRVRRLPAPPVNLRIDARSKLRAAAGHVEMESSAMGAWLVTRSTYGRLSGFTEDWCDLPHWGMVLDGSLILHWEHREIELLSPGDVFLCPAGPPGHRIEVADRATIVDYTPIAAFDAPGLRRALRSAAAAAGLGAVRPPRRNGSRAGVPPAVAATGLPRGPELKPTADRPGDE